MVQRQLSFIAYDTMCRISAAVPDGVDGAAILKEAGKLAFQVEETLSMFDGRSELSRMCRDYVPGQAYVLSPMLFTFMEQTLKVAEMTGGAFDPTVGPLVKLWDFLADDPKIPAETELREVLDHIGYQHILIERERQSAVFDCAGIGFDPGAAGKGFALELVAEFLKTHSVTQAVLDFGEIFT